MAHIGQVDGITGVEQDGLLHEGSRTEEVKMMKGLTQTMKHQLKEFNELPSTTNQMTSQPDDFQ
eukprot:9482349-Prorocentrum_lima.AAC.1